MSLNLYKAIIKNKAYQSITVMAATIEEAKDDIIKSEHISIEDIISIEEK